MAERRIIIIPNKKDIEPNTNCFFLSPFNFGEGPSLASFETLGKTTSNEYIAIKASKPTNTCLTNPRTSQLLVKLITPT